MSQWAEGRAEVFGKGSIVWYHEGEPVHGQILRAPWRFLTLNFIAPALPPPPDDRRVQRASPATLRLGRRLLTLWRNQSLPPLERQVRCHRALLELLLEVLPRARSRAALPPQAKLWWRIEKQLRGQLEKPVTLADIQRLSGFSPRTVARACQAATNLSPLKRLREIRLGFARGLVQHSDLPITEIAYRLGYARPQEFSRDYNRRFATTPRADRRRPPAYRRLVRPSPAYSAPSANCGSTATGRRCYSGAKPILAARRTSGKIRAQAVAEHQPANKNRMTSGLSTFAARLRESIRSGFQTENFGALALELFALQFANNAPYRKICEARQRHAADRESLDANSRRADGGVQGTGTRPACRRRSGRRFFIPAARRSNGPAGIFTTRNRWRFTRRRSGRGSRRIFDLRWAIYDC